MPDPVSPGNKSPAGVPPVGTGAGSPDPSTGSPPEDLEFEDDQVVEQDGKKMVPLEALLGEREKWKRRVAATPPAAPPPVHEAAAEPEPTAPLFNWDKLVPRGAQSQPVAAQGPPPLSAEQFEDQFRDALNERPWQALQWAIQTGMSYKDRMETQARQFVPDYTTLPVHEVSDQEVQMLASNPYAMKAMIAKAKAVGRQAPRASTPPPAATPATTPEQQRWIEQGRQMAMDMVTRMGKTPGVSGEGTGGPSSPPPSGEVVELDKDSVQYLKSRGYTDEQIKTQARKIVEIRRKKGMMV